MDIEFKPDQTVVTVRLTMAALADAAAGTNAVQRILLTPYGLRWCAAGQVQGTFLPWSDIGAAEPLGPEVSLVARDGRFLASWWLGYGNDADVLASVINGHATRFRDQKPRRATLDPRLTFLRMDVAG